MRRERENKHTNDTPHSLDVAMRTERPIKFAGFGRILKWVMTCKCGKIIETFRQNRRARKKISRYFDIAAAIRAQIGLKVGMHVLLD
jgi:hypothetical protein